MGILIGVLGDGYFVFLLDGVKERGYVCEMETIVKFAKSSGFLPTMNYQFLRCSKVLEALLNDVVNGKGISLTVYTHSTFNGHYYELPEKNQK